MITVIFETRNGTLDAERTNSPSKAIRIAKTMKLQDRLFDIVLESIDLISDGVAELEAMV